MGITADLMHIRAVQAKYPHAGKVLAIPLGNPSEQDRRVTAIAAAAPVILPPF